MDMTCPKCHGTMRTYERNGVHVDQCSDCRGIFLDRGELERLVDAETAWNRGRSPGQTEHRQEYRPESRESRESHGQGAGLGAVVSEVLGQVRAQPHGTHGQPYGHRRKKESFLSDLFG